MTRVAARLQPFGTTIFAEMTALANKHGAVNLAQGFPDFDGPEAAKAAAKAAIDAGEAQYARMSGVPKLNQAVAGAFAGRTGLAIDPDAHVTITSGCTEAIAATFLGLINPGDEVILFEPFYDSYRACVAMAGARPRFVTLRPGARVGGKGFGFDPDELRRAFTDKTRAILVNTPHNPTGKVFTRAELELIAGLCRDLNVMAITDEVYEHLTYDASKPHVSLASMPGMFDRTVTLSSVGKSFSLTGWKIGWAIAPPTLTAGVRAAHQFLTFATATPLQHGAAAIIANPGAAVREYVDLFRRNRDVLSSALRELGFRVYDAEGTYFIMADHTEVSRRLGVTGDRGLCAAMIEKYGVAAIPPSVFYENQEHGRSLVRFTYCKKAATIDEAIRRLERMRTA
ncbi:MAG: aminotransferase class I/II-fold pyridoxal phosphate-dependent enzyme [Phycisphaerales bacterium]|nr:aminotransferase class I/II-fold pyridoxal phosphate-dependent enzyme [Phycisphaerales bacterium]